MMTALKEQLRKLVVRLNQPFILQAVLVSAAFIVPVIILYIIDGGSFEYLWKGRAPYLLFLWLFFLELALGWKKLKTGQHFGWNPNTLLTAIVLVLPTVYALGYTIGVYDAVVELGRICGVPVQQYGEWYLTHSWTFSFEYILFAALFLASILLLYGKEGVKVLAVSSFFLGGVGIFYMIDTYYPYGTFTALQSFVPVTVHTASFILNSLGYGTQTFPAGADGLGLSVTGATRTYNAIVSWSCAGSHSLFIYSFMIMLFLRGTSISQKRKIVYVVAGAVGTFFVNIFRITAILLAGVNSGESLAAAFHEVYGEFFFIAWMFIYLSIIYLLETRVFRKKVDLQKPDSTQTDIVAS